MIERNRNTDKDAITSLEKKIKALESDITVAKQQNVERRLDKLDQSLTNTTMPAMNDNSLLDDELPVLEDTPCKEQRALMNKVNELMQSGKQKLTNPDGDENNVLTESVLQEDELAILENYGGEQQVGSTTQGANDIILEYDEYEQQLMKEICGEAGSELERG